MNARHLLMLDLVMLWAARAYAVWMLGLNFVLLIFYSNPPDTVTIVMPSPIPGHLGATGEMTVSTHHGPMGTLIVSIFLFSCLIFGLLMLHRPMGRMIVRVAAVGVLLQSLYGVFHLVYLITTASSVSADFLHTKLPVVFAAYSLNIAIQILIIRLAFRSLGAWRENDDELPPPFASPQTS